MSARGFYICWLLFPALLEITNIEMYLPVWFRLVMPIVLLCTTRTYGRHCAWVLHTINTESTDAQDKAGDGLSLSTFKK